jgi:hypothetical protein
MSERKFSERERDVIKPRILESKMKRILRAVGTDGIEMSEET